MNSKLKPCKCGASGVPYRSRTPDNRWWKILCWECGSCNTAVEESEAAKGWNRLNGEKLVEEEFEQSCPSCLYRIRPIEEYPCVECKQGGGEDDAEDLWISPRRGPEGQDDD